MQYGIDFLSLYGSVPESRSWESLYVSRSRNRDSDDSDSNSGGGGSSFLIDTVNPQEIESPYSYHQHPDDSPYIPGRDQLYRTPPPEFTSAPESDHHNASYSYNPQLYPQQSDPGRQRMGYDRQEYQHPEIPSISRISHTRTAHSSQESSTSYSSSRDGPPPDIPDAGKYLRMKHHIPIDVDVNLYALPEPPDGQRPTHPLPALIALAIYGSPRKMLTLQQIYTAIEERFAYYRNTQDGWKNSIRHNLSLNLLFRKKSRPITEPGKGQYWYIDITKGEGNKRKRKRKGRTPRQSGAGESGDDRGSVEGEVELRRTSPGFDNIDPGILNESSSGPQRSSSQHRRMRPSSRQGYSPGPSQQPLMQSTLGLHLTPNQFDSLPPHGSYMSGSEFGLASLPHQNIPNPALGHSSFSTYPPGPPSSAFIRR